MSFKRFVLAIALAATISFLLVPMTSQAGVAQDASCSHQVHAAATPIPPGSQCIPCSPSRPCVNPLTVCSYNGKSNHGCCLGYASQH